MPRVFTIAEGLENMGALKTGGQGSIYKVRRTIDNKISAVKLLRTPIYSESHTDKHFVDFQNEVQKLKKVNEVPNPNVVKILSSGITETGSLPFIEMEFIEGPDLEELLKPPHTPVFTITETIRVAEQLSNALAHCHKVNVKHGDIKSNNVKFNEETGNYVLLDFGLAVMSDEERRTSLRQAGAIEFMAPEQNEGVMLFETDVYSFGVILYELLAGMVPFPLKSKSETARNKVMIDHMETAPPNMLSLRKQHLPDNWAQDELNVPQWLVNTIYKCLEKSPGSRFRNGMELYGHIKLHNTLGSPQKAWHTEQLELLKQQNEKLLRQKEELQQQLGKLQLELQQSVQKNNSQEPLPETKPSGGRGSWQILLIVLLLCAVLGVFAYTLLSANRKEKPDNSAGKEPDKPAQVVGQYKVLSQRAYFHNEPDENTKRTAYMIPSNDVVTALQEKNDFVYTEFTNSRGQTSKGWIRKQDLISLEDWAKRGKSVEPDAKPAQEDINTQLKDARDLLANDQVKEALYIYSYLSEQRVPEAMYQYGLLALQGRNDDIDCQEAMRLLNSASDRGYVPAKTTLGFLYIFAENPEVLQMNNYERCEYERNMLMASKLLLEAVAAGDSTAKKLLNEVEKWTGDGDQY